MTRHPIPLIALVLLAPTLAAAQVSNQPSAEGYRLRVEYRWFESELAGTASMGVGEVPGTLFDVQDDLLIQEDRTWEVRGSIRVGEKMKLRGGYTALDYKGDVELASRIRFGGTTFEAGDQVASSLKGGYYGGDLEYDLVLHRSGFLGLTAGVRVPDVDFVLSAPEEGKRELGTERPFSPVLGLVGRIYMGRLSLEGSGATFAKISGYRVTEFDFSARIHLSDRLAVSGGYRYFGFKYEAGGELGDIVDMHSSGWTYGIEVGL
jgi:hypothetical protein